MMSCLTTVSLMVWVAVPIALIVLAIVVIAGRFNLPRAMIVVAGGGPRTSKYTRRKTKESRDQEASGNATKISHGLSPRVENANENAQRILTVNPSH
jgi:hypothetical protein